MQNKNSKKLNEWLKMAVCRFSRPPHVDLSHLLLALLHSGQPRNSPPVSTKSKQKKLASFSVEAMVKKATEPTRITGPLFSVKNTMSDGRWQLGQRSSHFLTCEEQWGMTCKGVTRKGVVNCCVHANVKIENCKYSIFVKFCTHNNFLPYKSWMGHGVIELFIFSLVSPTLRELLENEGD